jgi:hypothetical protein
VRSAVLTLLGAAGVAATAGLVTPRVPAPWRSPDPGAPTRPAPVQEDVPYDGRFTFVRIQYDVLGGRSLRGFGRGGGREPEWAHDYPRAETNFAKIISETTMIDPYMGGSRILRMDDPEVFRYPLIYVVEVGYWDASRREIEALGLYLQKGGFMIVDDFRAEQIYQLEAIVQQALPGIRMIEVPSDHEIFDSFFHIDDPHALAPPTFQQYRPVYLGLFEDNDPTKRLMAILNYNNDIGDYWEWSDMGYYPIDLSNEAYKFGVNYLVYAMTH